MLEDQFHQSQTCLTTLRHKHTINYMYCSSCVILSVLVGYSWYYPYIQANNYFALLYLYVLLQFMNVYRVLFCTTRKGQTNDGKQSNATWEFKLPFYSIFPSLVSPFLPIDPHLFVFFSLPSSLRNSCTYPSPSLSSSSYSSRRWLMLPEPLPSRKLR